MRPAGIVFLAVLLPTVSYAQAAEEMRTFGDWLTGCRSDGYCVATAHDNANPAGGSGANTVLRVGRHAEEIYWEVSLTTLGPVADPAGAFTVRIDAGTALVFEGAAEVAAYGSGTDFFFMGKGAQAVMDQLAPGSTVEVAFTDMDGEVQRAGFSLKGLTASLIWIDEKQKRLGSERVAEAPPVGLAPIDGDAALLASVPAALMAERDADTQCRPIPELANGTEIEIDPSLSGSAKLYILPCWDAAYNFGWRAYVEPFVGEFEQVALPEFSPTSGWTASTHLVNYAYDSATKELSTFNKARGAGDCGSAGTYRWDRYQFRLIEYRYRECRDEPIGDDKDAIEFPVVYPSAHGRAP